MTGGKKATLSVFSKQPENYLGFNFDTLKSQNWNFKTEVFVGSVHFSIITKKYFEEIVFMVVLLTGCQIAYNNIIFFRGISVI